MTDAGQQLQDVDKLIGELETQFTVHDSGDPDISMSSDDNCSGTCTVPCTGNCTYGCTGANC